MPTSTAKTPTNVPNAIESNVSPHTAPAMQLPAMAAANVCSSGSADRRRAVRAVTAGTAK